MRRYNKDLEDWEQVMAATIELVRAEVTRSQAMYDKFVDQCNHRFDDKGVCLICKTNGKTMTQEIAELRANIKRLKWSLNQQD
jgi:hypothetical protein